MEAFPYFILLFGKAPHIPKIMSLLPSSPKIITSAPQLPENEKKTFSPDPQNPGGPELVALLSLSYWCLVVVVWLFLAVPWVCLRFVIVVFPNHTHLLFFIVCTLSDGCTSLTTWTKRPVRPVKGIQPLKRPRYEVLIIYVQSGPWFLRWYV